MQYPYMLTYALYTAADWAPCRGLGPGPGHRSYILRSMTWWMHNLT